MIKLSHAACSLELGLQRQVQNLTTISKLNQIAAKVTPPATNRNPNLNSDILMPFAFCTGAASVSVILAMAPVISWSFRTDHWLILYRLYQYLKKFSSIMNVRINRLSFSRNLQFTCLPIM